MFNISIITKNNLPLCHKINLIVSLQLLKDYDWH